MKEICTSGLVELEKVDDIGIIRLNNGNQNKIDRAEFLDLAVLQKWIESFDWRGLIITAKGRNFSPGANLEKISTQKNNIEEFRSDLKKGHSIIQYIKQLSIIKVAAIQGICFGAGLEIALTCDFRICSDNAIFAFPETNLGIMPGLAGTISLPGLIGYKKALELIISGDSVDAEKAKEIGLVDSIAPKNGVLDYSIKFIERLTNNKSKQVVKFVMKALNNYKLLHEKEASVKEMELFLQLARTFDTER